METEVFVLTAKRKPVTMSANRTSVTKCRHCAADIVWAKRLKGVQTYPVEIHSHGSIAAHDCPGMSSYWK